MVLAPNGAKISAKQPINPFYRAEIGYFLT